jgi:hypothetical protein
MAVNEETPTFLILDCFMTAVSNSMEILKISAVYRYIITILGHSLVSSQLAELVYFCELSLKIYVSHSVSLTEVSRAGALTASLYHYKKLLRNASSFCFFA